MAHVQQQIIEWFQTTLVGGSTAAGTSVFSDRLDPLTNDELPAAVIGGGDESVEPLTIGNEQLRSFEVNVASTVSQTAGYEAAARDLGLEVEKLLAAQPATAGGLCSGGISLTGSRLQKAGEGETAVAAVVQTWLCKYIVAAHAPDIPL